MKQLKTTTRPANSNLRSCTGNNCRYISTLRIIDDLIRAVDNDHRVHFSLPCTDVPAFEGSKVQYLADWCVVVNRAAKRKNLAHDTLLGLGAGIDAHMRMLPSEECLAIRNFYVATLKDSRRLTDLEVTYRRWIHEGTFFERMHLLINLGKVAA